MRKGPTQWGLQVCFAWLTGLKPSHVTMHIHVLHMWHSIHALFHNLLTSPKSLQMDTMLDVSAANSTDTSFCIVTQVGA